MLQQLEALSQLSGSRDQQRHDRSGKLLADGLHLLQLAEDEGYANPLRLQEASGLLVEAIKLRRNDVRPYLGLAYVFMLIEDHAKALKYIRQALQLEPDNQLVRSFQARIAEDQQRVASRRQQLRHGSPVQRAAQPAVTPDTLADDEPILRFTPEPEAPAAETADTDEVDYDALYDQTGDQIRKLLRELMLAGLPNPVADEAGIAALEKRLAKQSAVQAQIQKQLDIVDQDIDVADLVRLLKPVDAHLRRLGQLIELSRQLSALRVRICDDIEAAAQICEEARQTADPADIPVLEENLEALLDNADGYAQAIEDLQQKHDQLADIEAQYSKLQEKIESYQDALEEAQARLGV